MTVFTNTGPLIALAGIGQLELLQGIFGVVHAASTVVDECMAGGPIAVPNLRGLGWLTIVDHRESQVHPLFRELDRGESDTLSLALAQAADLVIIDERLGRQAAEQAGLAITGTLGVLAKAKASRLIPSFTAAAEAMRAAGIRFHPDLVAKIAVRVGE